MDQQLFTNELITIEIDVSVFLHKKLSNEIKFCIQATDNCKEILTLDWVADAAIYSERT